MTSSALTMRPRVGWIVGLAAICAFMLLCTLLPSWPFRIRALLIFNLRDESNLAALWSGMLVLLAALHAYDGWVAERSRSLLTAYGWLSLSAILAGLSFDEIGSVHERLTSASWTPLLPAALVFGACFCFTIVVFYRSESHRLKSIIIALAFMLFASIALQEEIEHAVEWPYYLIGLRAVTEEGTELAAMLLLVFVALPNTGGVFSPGGARNSPVFDATIEWRLPSLAIGIVGIPVLTFVTRAWEPGPYGHGLPADWPIAAAFFLAGIAALRPLFLNGSTNWRRWMLAGASVAGCASSILASPSPIRMPLLAAVAGLTAVILVVDDDFSARSYLAPFAAIVVFLGFGFALPEHSVAHSLAGQFIALAYFIAISTGAKPNHA